MRLVHFWYVVVVLFISLLLPVSGNAGDFGWLEEFNVKAHADPDDFRARIRARFSIGNAKIDVALGTVETPADVYMVYRLSEISEKPVAYVMYQYKARKGNGWGALAKSLGIKPGSREFHALKRRNDLYVLGNNGNRGRKMK